MPPRPYTRPPPDPRNPGACARCLGMIKRGRCKNPVALTHLTGFCWAHDPKRRARRHAGQHQHDLRIKQPWARQLCAAVAVLGLPCDRQVDPKRGIGHCINHINQGIAARNVPWSRGPSGDPAPSIYELFIPSEMREMSLEQVVFRVPGPMSRMARGSPPEAYPDPDFDALRNMAVEDALTESPGLRRMLNGQGRLGRFGPFILYDSISRLPDNWRLLTYTDLVNENPRVYLLDDLHVPHGRKTMAMREIFTLDPALEAAYQARIDDKSLAELVRSVPRGHAPALE